MKLELKEIKEGVTWVSVNDNKGQSIGWISLIDFAKGKNEQTMAQADARRVAVAKQIVKSFNATQEGDE